MWKFCRICWQKNSGGLKIIDLRYKKSKLSSWIRIYQNGTKEQLWNRTENCTGTKQIELLCGYGKLNYY